MTAIIIVIAIVFIASIVHASAGFGYSILTMMFFPLYFTVPESIVLKTFSELLLLLGIAIRYRKKIDFKMLLWPLLLAVPGVLYGLFSVTTIDNSMAMKILGGALILLSIYFYFLSNSIKIPGNKWTAMIGGGLSGGMAGLFGVPGPPIVLYYSVVFKNKETYMGTIQVFFLMLDMITLVFLGQQMHFTNETLMMMPVVLGTSLVGLYIGGLVFKRMSSGILHKVIYAMMFLSGVYYLFK